MRNSLPDAVRSKTRFVLITNDAERDSVEKLSATAQKYGLDQPSWLLLRASTADTWELTVLLGLKYIDVAGGEISHSNEFILLDSNGVILGRHVGLSDDYAAFLNQVPTQ